MYEEEIQEAEEEEAAEEEEVAETADREDQERTMCPATGTKERLPS